MIEPFEPGQVQARSTASSIVSYGTSSYGYDVRCSRRIQDLHQHQLARSSTRRTSTTKSLRRLPRRRLHHPAELVRAGAHGRVLPHPAQRADDLPRQITYARCGIIVNVTPLEPEWEGHVTLEFSNTTPLPAKIYANEGVAQVLFFESDESLRDLVQGPRRQVPGPAGRHAAQNLTRLSPVLPLFQGVRHEIPLSHRHHRRGFPLREHLRPRHPRACRGDREGGHGSRSASRATATCRSSRSSSRARRPSSCRSTTRNSRRAPEIDQAVLQPARVHRGDPLPQRRDPDLPLRRDADVAAHPERHPARAARLHPHVRGHAGVRRAPHHPRGAQRTSTRWRRRSSARWSTTRRTAPIRGTARATRAASRS